MFAFYYPEEVTTRFKQHQTSAPYITLVSRCYATVCHKMMADSDSCQ